MKINYLFERIRKENWWRHTLTFLGTITGILIALALDKYKETNNEQKKLKSFLQLVNNELILNQNQLTYQIKGNQLNLITLEFALKKKLKHGSFISSSREIDSLFTIHPELVDYIIKESKIDEDLYSYASQINFPNADIRTDSWEMIKYSGLMSELNPFIAFQYSEIYRMLAIKNDFIEQKSIITLIQQSMADNKITEDELIEIQNHIEISRLQNEFKIQAIKNGLKQISNIENEKNEKWTLEIDPIDSLSLKWNNKKK